MEYGLPAAIGAKMAHLDALIIDIVEDASFSMTLSELSTAAQFNVGVKVLLLNTEEQGMVNPDFVALSEAMHVQARWVSDPKELAESLKWLVHSQGPALLEVITDKKVSVLPTVRSGCGLDELIAYDEEQEKQRRELIRERTNGIHG
ncbi:hypothetical protein FocTR4_00002320 [Fusarium oxysporum f. sp. cubense]|nr:hypothetical protein FocTR4_00002320 [Fusarium oxysporum f. sp. cubense]